MFRQNLAHTGLSPHDTRLNAGALLWSFTAGGPVLSSAAIGVDGTVFTGSFDGVLHAIDPRNGSEVWSVELGGSLHSSPAIASDGTVYMGTIDGDFYAISPNGSVRWIVRTGRIFLSSPAISPDGTIYVGAQDNRLYAINPNGTVRWTYPTGHFVDSSPAIGADGTIYFGSVDGRLYAVNPVGTLRWIFSVPGYPIQSSPAIGPDGMIYFGAADGHLYAVTPNGTKEWSFPTGPGAVISSPAIDSKGTIYVGASQSGYVYAVGQDGLMSWRFQTGGYVLSSPSIGSDGTIYVGSDDYNLYALMPNGTQKWRFPTAGWVGTSPAIAASGAIYFGSSDSRLYALGPTSMAPDYAPAGALPSGRVTIGLHRSVIFSADVTNLGGTTNASAKLAFFNASTPGMPFAAVDVPPVAAEGRTGPFSAMWTSPTVPGTYAVVVDVDSANAIAESNESNNRHLWTVDVVPGPVTSLVVGQPTVTVTVTHLTSSTPLSFFILDQSGAGIRNTSYRVDGGPPVNYTAMGPFVLSGEGPHLLEWSSEDHAGNVEEVASATLYIDDTPPTTDFAIGNPKYLAGRMFVRSATPISLAAADGGIPPVGLAATEVQFDGDPSWTRYDGPFYLTTEGLHSVGYRSTDLLGNVELSRTEWLVVDNTPPSLVVDVGSPRYEGEELYVTSSTPLTIAAADSGPVPVGLAATEYRLGDSWTLYSGSISVPGPDGSRTVEYRARDLLDHTSVGQIALVVDNTPPTTTPSHLDGTYPKGTAITFTAMDAGSGVARTEVRVDGDEAWTQHELPVRLTVGHHMIAFRSIDRLNNTEPERWLSITIEGALSTPRTETNWKPAIAAVFAVILALVGAWSAKRMPWKTLGGRRAVLSAFAASSLPFVVAEATTGVVSHFTGLLSIPPILGAGTAVDISILAVGLAIALIRARPRETQQAASAT